mmetsp:Transcript_60940/g.161838  ORF Transcript_60940/g.161838 Transcript_60940/m.161838 type:complete len:363 (+) Transcript_60940:496-1584(+)
MPEGQTVVVPHLLLVQGQRAEVAGDCFVKISLCLLVLSVVQQDLAKVIQRHRVSFQRIRRNGTFVRGRCLVQPPVHQIQIRQVKLCPRGSQLLQAVYQCDLIDTSPVQDTVIADDPPDAARGQHGQPRNAPSPESPMGPQVGHAHKAHQRPDGGNVQQAFCHEGPDGKEQVHHRQKTEKKDRHTHRRALGQPPSGNTFRSQGQQDEARPLQKRHVSCQRQEQTHVENRMHQRYRVHGVIITQKVRPHKQLHVNPVDKEIGQTSDNWVLRSRNGIAMRVHPLDGGAPRVRISRITCQAAQEERYRNSATRTRDVPASNLASRHDEHLPDHQQTEKSEARLLAQPRRHNKYESEHEPQQRTRKG